MNITDVRIRLVAKDDSKLRAVASVTIDECIAIHDIKIIDGNDGYFVSMPAKKNSKGEYKDMALNVISFILKNIYCNFIISI